MSNASLSFSRPKHDILNLCVTVVFSSVRHTHARARMHRHAELSSSFCCANTSSVGLTVTSFFSYIVQFSTKKLDHLILPYFK